MAEIIHYYKPNAVSDYELRLLLSEINSKVTDKVIGIRTEADFSIEVQKKPEKSELEVLEWLLREQDRPQDLTRKPQLKSANLLEVGYNFNFEPTISSNAVNVLDACGIRSVIRLQPSRRYQFVLKSGTRLTKEEKEAILALIHDPMTEQQYKKTLTTFDTGAEPKLLETIDILNGGISAIHQANVDLGLGMDAADEKEIYNLFRELRQNPNDLTLLDYGNCCSEHCRHRFFKGVMNIDNVEQKMSLMDLVKEPWKRNPGNALVAFSDNSSTIRGFEIPVLVPEDPTAFSRFVEETVTYHSICSAETHNHPCLWAAVPGAETGIGGLIRDIMGMTRGSLLSSGAIGYSVGQLLIPGYHLPWEDRSWVYEEKYESPLEILIKASNGGSDYANKVGFPLPLGYTRSTAVIVGGERKEYIKPIVYVAGYGQQDDRHLEGNDLDIGIKVYVIGGKNYRIGVCGGAASSMTAGANTAERDYSSVQRGNGLTEQADYRVIRACVEMGKNNPIWIETDEGAGGNCVGIKELMNPAGGWVALNRFPLGDKTLSPGEIWANESQERMVVGVKPNKTDIFEGICQREGCPYVQVGETTGDGRFRLINEETNEVYMDLKLKDLLAEVGRKTWNLETVNREFLPLNLPYFTIREGLERVLRLLEVASKHFLMPKADRSVTGLIAQQQTVGSLQLPLADCAVTAQSYLSLTGQAESIGEQPNIGLVNPKAMARKTLVEALLNLSAALITKRENINFSVNCMAPAKLAGEGANLYRAYESICEAMINTETRAHGGKDSLSMAADVTHPDGTVETVKSPNTLVLTAHAPCPDVRRVFTPDIKRAGKSRIMLVDLGRGASRLGASAIAHSYNQVGAPDEVSDIDDMDLVSRTFDALQELEKKNLILSYHDISDGGRLVNLMEMAFAGNCGLEINLNSDEAEKFCFSEESGCFFEYLPHNLGKIRRILKKYRIFGISSEIAKTTKAKKIRVNNKRYELLADSMQELRDIWQETSYRIELLQANPGCVEAERLANYCRKGPKYVVPFEPKKASPVILRADIKPKVAVIRDLGTNGDREMVGAAYLAGFESYDIDMDDIIKGKASLKSFQAILLAGGFTREDVFGAGKGQAATALFNERAKEEFYNFFGRKDTAALGVCNGCQYMSILGVAPWSGIPDISKPRFIKNKSGRFESRWVTVKILPSSSIWLQGMEGLTFGIWVAHGEGRAYFPDKEILEGIKEKNLAPIRYVDDDGNITEQYPFNPNGSTEGITGISSEDGRFLMMMPHPERSQDLQYIVWYPENLKSINYKTDVTLKRRILGGFIGLEYPQGITTSPWTQCFHNIYDFVANA